MSEPSATSGRSLSVAAHAELVQLLLAFPDLSEFLERLAHLAAGLIGPTATCGITVRHSGRTYTAAMNDTLAGQADELQYEAGDGPCLEALRTGRTVHAPDLMDDTRWGAHRSRLVALSLLSLHCVPLHNGVDRVGALNVYARTTDAFGPPEVAALAAFAAQASEALGIALRQADQVETSAQLKEALVARAVIDQALGVVMAQQRCSADAAFAILRTASQHRNRPLRDVAADLVRAVSGAAPRPGAPFTDHR